MATEASIRLLLRLAAVVGLTALACAAPVLAPTAVLTPAAETPTATRAIATPRSTATSTPPPGLTATPPAQTFKIMPLGDSITQGWPGTDHGGYRRLLGTLLVNDGYHIEFVGSLKSGTGVIPDPDNEGHFGWTILQIKTGIDTKGWLETYQPDLILLHIGTNDMHMPDPAAAPDRLSALLDDILGRRPKTRIIVAQIIPFRPGPDPAHEAYNAAIPGIVAARGARVSLVDMQTILTPADYADGIHPNASGYDEMARAWEPAVRAAIAAIGSQH